MDPMDQWIKRIEEEPDVDRRLDLILIFLGLTLRAIEHMKQLV